MKACDFWAFSGYGDDEEFVSHVQLPEFLEDQESEGATSILVDICREDVRGTHTAVAKLRMIG